MNETPPAPTRPPHTGHGRHGGRDRRRFVREPDDRKIAGVCSGLAGYLGLDVTLVRVGVVALSLLTPAAVVAYVVAAVTVQERRPDEPRPRAHRVHLGTVPVPLLVVGAVVAVAAFVDEAWWLDPFPAAVALIGVGVWLVIQSRDDADQRDPGGPDRSFDQPGTPGAEGTPSLRHPLADAPGVVTVSQHSDTVGGSDTTFAVAPETDPPGSRQGAGPPGELPPPASPWWSGNPEPVSPRPLRPPARGRSSRLGLVMVALLLVGGGVLSLLAGLDAITLSGQDAVALGLLATGVGLLVAAWRGRAYALIPIGLVLASLLLLDDVVDVPLDAGTGDRTTVVDGRQELGERHELLAGELTLDLTEAPLSDARSTTVEASVGMGRLHVLVPDGATVEVDAATTAGEVLSPAADIDEGGVGVEESFTLDGDRGGPRLELDLSVGLGNVEVFRG